MSCVLEIKLAKLHHVSKVSAQLIYRLVLMCRCKVGVRRAEDERFSLMAIDEKTRSRNQQDPAGLACLKRKIQFNLMVK